MLRNSNLIFVGHWTGQLRSPWQDDACSGFSVSYKWCLVQWQLYLLPLWYSVVVIIDMGEGEAYSLQWKWVYVYMYSYMKNANPIMCLGFWDIAPCHPDQVLNALHLVECFDDSVCLDWFVKATILAFTPISSQFKEAKSCCPVQLLRSKRVPIRPDGYADLHSGR